MKHLSELHHPDTVRQLLRDLHQAAEQHRFVSEQIDFLSPNEGSHIGKVAVYLGKIDAVRRAVNALADYQYDLQRQVDATRHEAQVDAAIAELLAPYSQRRPGCDEHEG